MFWRTKRPHIDAKAEAFILEHWEWLDGILGPVAGDKPRELFFPSRRLFPDTELKGHARAIHYFELVQRYAGLENAHYELVAQSPRAQLGSSVVFGGTVAASAPAGTYSQRDNVARITYDPAILSDPIHTVTVFAHELAHDILLNHPIEPPGGPEMEEYATDLAVAHLGFGLFGANSAFQFQQFTDFDRQGWSYSRTGYLSENQWGFAVALFLALQGRPSETVDAHLKPHLLSVVVRAKKYLDAHPAILGPLRRA